jgi:hypothetical protein
MKPTSFSYVDRKPTYDIVLCESSVLLTALRKSWHADNPARWPVFLLEQSNDGSKKYVKIEHKIYTMFGD